MKKLLLISILIFSQLTLANAPKVGRAAAARYFQKERIAEQNGYTPAQPKQQRKTSSDYPTYAQNTPEPSYSGGSATQLKDHYMTLGFGTYSDSEAYKWGQGGKQESVGKWGIDLTYRFQEQEYLFDQSLRVSYNHYVAAGQNTDKLSFLMAVTFPEATSKFPLYFGGAAGLGVFTKPIPEESVISFDYQLFLGVRIFDVYETVGLFVEGGLRNHLNLTSDGQFNGTFLSIGTVFLF